MSTVDLDIQNDAWDQAEWAADEKARAKLAQDVTAEARSYAQAGLRAGAPFVVAREMSEVVAMCESELGPDHRLTQLLRERRDVLIGEMAQPFTPGWSCEEDVRALQRVSRAAEFTAAEHLPAMGVELGALFRALSVAAREGWRYSYGVPRSAVAFAKAYEERVDV